MGKTTNDRVNLRHFITADGSSSLYNEVLDETYHSKHGALQESRHVFIDMGLMALSAAENIQILEVGFGTGLNALLTMRTTSPNTSVTYRSIETYPLPEPIYSKLKFDLGNEEQDIKDLFIIHQAPWDVLSQIRPLFFLEKRHCSVQEFEHNGAGFDLIYYDAFGPQVQSEMWTQDIFLSLYSWLKPGGILVTYCAKGEVRRNMINAGFNVERLAGPPGKREMLRAIRPLISG